MARQMGADLVLDARDDVVARLRAETDGNGVDIVLEMSGSAAALHQGLAAVTNGGRVSLLGTHTVPATIDLSQEVIFKGIRIYGITGRRLWDTWYRTTALLEEGLDITPIITHRLPLADYAQAFDLVASGPRRQDRSVAAGGLTDDDRRADHAHRPARLPRRGDRRAARQEPVSAAAHHDRAAGRAHDGRRPAGHQPVVEQLPRA